MPNLGLPELIILLIIVAAIVSFVRYVMARPGQTKTGTTDTGPIRQGATSPPGWFPDPKSRHEFRYWDGSQWTATVSDKGAQSTDPI